jgi:DNA-binding transcriptional MerR regulator
MRAPERHFSPAETARRLGVTVKALRVYEARGLLQPQRTQAGWRVYGGAELARLHQILVLKGLGLSLTQVAALLAGKMARMDAVLDLQAATLRRRRDQIDEALTLLTKARARLRDGGNLSLDDLTQLTKETLMTEPLTQEEYRAAFDPLWRKHLSTEEIATLEERRKSLLSGPEYTQADVSRAWNEIFAEARSLMEAGDTTSPRARALLARWMNLAEKFTGGDLEISRKTSEIWREALSDPALAPRLPVGADLWAFVQNIARETLKSEE